MSNPLFATKSLDVLMKEASDSGRAIANADRMRVEVKDIQQAVFRRSVGD